MDPILLDRVLHRICARKSQFRCQTARNELEVSKQMSLLKPILAASFLAIPSAALAVDCTSEESILEVTMDSKVCLSLDELKALEATSFTTTTLWTEGANEYTGVLLSDLLAHLGASGQEIKATAINDYAISIPISDAVEGGPIVAYHQDGNEMSRRDKGPLWVIYPFDSSTEYRSETIYSRSIWQLDRMEIIN